MSIGSTSIIIAAGGHGFSVSVGSSVEILDPQSNQWIEGPELPYGLYKSAMATSPDGNGVILVGGLSGTINSDYIFHDSILELKADGQGWVGAWTTLTTKLQIARSGHIVIPVLMNKNICGLDGIVSPTTDRQIEQRQQKQRHIQFHVITVINNKPIKNTMVKATISHSKLTGFTDEKGFVELGPISDGEVGSIEIDGYENLEKEFTFPNALDFMTLEMTPTGSQIGYRFSSLGYGHCEFDCGC